MWAWMSRSLWSCAAMERTRVEGPVSMVLRGKMCVKVSSEEESAWYSIVVSGIGAVGVRVPVEWRCSFWTVAVGRCHGRSGYSWSNKAGLVKFKNAMRTGAVCGQLLERPLRWKSKNRARSAVRLGL